LHATRLGAFTLLLAAAAAAAQGRECKIGVIFDETEPFAGGSKANLIGTKLAIDMINDQCRVAERS